MITVIGTSHISPQSLREIQEKIDEIGPDCVAVELDANRLEAIRRGEKVSISAMKYIGFRGYLTAKIFSTVQQYLGKKTGVIPGEEMLTAVEAGKRAGAVVALIDQPIEVTMRRLQGIPFVEKAKLLLGIFKPKKVAFDISKVPEEKLVAELMGYMKKTAPTLYRVLVAERDLHMAKALNQLGLQYDNIVAVVGIGHKKGLEKQLKALEGSSEISYRFVQDQQYL